MSCQVSEDNLFVEMCSSSVIYSRLTKSIEQPGSSSTSVPVTKKGSSFGASLYIRLNDGSIPMDGGSVLFRGSDCFIWLLMVMHFSLPCLQWFHLLVFVVWNGFRLVHLIAKNMQIRRLFFKGCDSVSLSLKSGMSSGWGGNVLTSTVTKTPQQIVRSNEIDSEASRSLGSSSMAYGYLGPGSHRLH